METRVECKNVDCSSKRVETFNGECVIAPASTGPHLPGHLPHKLDIQLDVDGCDDLDASFRSFTDQEDLTGDNQYRADAFGLQVSHMVSDSSLHFGFAINSPTRNVGCC